jgi:two-component system, LuxR family, sensor kinase FixL
MQDVRTAPIPDFGRLIRLWVNLRSAAPSRESLVLPLLVFLGYALGAQLGMLLRLPDTIPSVVWPPNAILTTALLFTPPRRWAVVFAAAFPAHLLAELGTWPWPLVLAFFVTNCSEAAIAGFGGWKFSDAPSRFDTLRRVTVFLVWAVALAPLISSFFDAAVASIFGGQDYWTVWHVRVPSNALSAVAIVPALSGVLHTRYPQLRVWPRQRWLDAAKIITGLLLAGMATSTELGRDYAYVPLGLFLPFMLWAAVKFGTAGAGLSLLATVLAAIASALYGNNILEHVPPDQRVHVFQLGLIAAAVPLMSLAALVEERRQAEDALRISDGLKSAILKSLPSHVAVLDRGGRVIAANDDPTGLASDTTLLESSYLDAWAGAADKGQPMAASALQGLRGVLDGSHTRFSMEYSTRGAQGQSWWLMRAVPLQRPDGGAVVTHTDMTETHRADLEARRSHDELVHLSRVLVVNELTTTLSHQLSQPLTGILGNAQAGRRFLDTTRKPDVEELRRIFADVVADAKRATELIRGLRDMLRKDSGAHQAVDISTVIEETARLVISDAAIRGLSLHLDLTPSLPSVRGNRVQLQQVILNLLLNAMDAVTVSSHAPGIVTVTTYSREPGSVVVLVSDTGPGLPASADAIFAPFFTTKARGLGLGLSIARSIVEAHHGTIDARNGENGGAVFSITLPSLEE